LGLVLVTDASERAALAVIRCLGKKGVQVLAAEAKGVNAGFLSKYCAHRVTYPSPIENKERFVESLLRLVKSVNLELLIPVTDFTMIPILERKEDFESYVKVAAPSYEVAMKAYDKFQTVDIAQRCGIPHPKTFLIDDVKTLREAASELSYPVVIKPRMKVFWKNGKAFTMKITSINYVYNKEELRARYEKLANKLKGIIHSDFFIIQEYVKGVGYGVEVLMNGSKLMALFMHKRLHEYPITGGASTLRISVFNRRLADYSIKLLREMDWQGVAMVEFKLNEKNDTATLIEVNGRFWGSLPLAIKAGVDFPYLLYIWLVKNESFTFPSYKLGIKQRWLIPGELLWLFSSIVNAGKVFASIRDFIVSFSAADDIVTFDDMSPLAGTLWTSLGLSLDVLRGKRNIAGELLKV
jgi:predicted ATP-grasp superfamily ATP-dependent carboligase